MPWNTLAVTDIEAEILPDEVSLLATIAGSDAVLQSILTTVLSELQAQILVGGNQIGQTGTIPDQIRGDAIAVVRWRWFCSLPKTDLQSEFRQKQYEAALTHLSTIREGREKVEIPASPQAVTGPSFRVETVRRGHEVRTRDFDTLGET